MFKEMHVKKETEEKKITVWGGKKSLEFGEKIRFS